MYRRAVPRLAMVTFSPGTRYSLDSRKLLPSLASFILDCESLMMSDLLLLDEPCLVAGRLVD